MPQDEKAPVIGRDFNDAIRHYGEGRLPQAEEICQKILAETAPEGLLSSGKRIILRR